MPSRCAVPNCNSGSRTQAKCSLFNVPKDVAMWKKWQDAIPGLVKLNPRDVVCEKHFKDEEICREWVKLDADGKVIARVTYKRPHLQKLATPSRFGNALAGKENCVPLHEYAKMPGNQTNPVTNDVANVPPSLRSARTSRSEILAVESSSMLVSSELPVAETFVSQIPVDVLPSMEINTNSVSSPAPVTGLSLSPMEESTCGPAKSNLIAPQTTPGVLTSHKFTEGIPEENASVNDLCAYVPEAWGLQNVRTQIVQQTLFTHVVTKIKNDVHCPVVQKAVTLDADGRLQYFIYGRHVDPQGKNLEQTLSGKEALKEILVKFRGMNICSGIGDVNTDFVRRDTAYQDYVDKWRSKDCSLVSRKKRCEACMKTRKCIQQRTARFKNSSALKRITNTSNPVDRHKLSVMQMKLRREKRQKIRAQDRMKRVKTCIKAQEAEISNSQKLVIEEIWRKRKNGLN